jgi:hypothetical protein
MGLPDCFPLALSAVAREKLRFVYEVIDGARERSH